MLFDHTLRELLRRAHTIAIVGAKDKPGSPVDRVGRYLMEAGYTVLPVHPVRKTVWGLPVVKHLGELAQVPDIVCLFRAAQYCPEHAREVLELPAKPLIFWMQEGIRSPEAGALLHQAGIAVVEDACLMTEHQRLLPAPPEQPALFDCARCGKCCQGRGGIILAPADQQRLARHLRIDIARLLEDYAEMRGGKSVLGCAEDGWCVFFRQGQGCAVHPARPDICRAWPFFRGNLVDETSFFMAKQDCPGIDSQARHAAFAHQGFAYLEQHGLLAADPQVQARALVVSFAELPRSPQDEAETDA